MEFENIVDILREKLPQGSILETNTAPLYPFLVIQNNALNPICELLFRDADFLFDYLSCITGVDNGVESNTFELIYSFYSIPKRHFFTLKTVLDRSNQDLKYNTSFVNHKNDILPKTTSISHLWKTADWHEREIFDLYGIWFDNHPDLRRILMPEDWIGFPLRKDYKEQEIYHGLQVPFPNVNKSDIQYEYHPDNFKNSDPNITSEESLDSEEMIISIGPQHPSTHGVLRLEVISDGEYIKKAVPHIGYLHRCFEKHAENLPFNQIIPFVDRMDYMAAMNSEHIFAMGVEKMMGIDDQIPKRVEYIRVLVAELNRIASHFVAIGTYGLDIGAFTPFLWLMRDREHILRLLEWLSGARMLYNYIWIGGLFYDLPIGFEERIREFCNYLVPKLDELNKVLIENKIFIERTAGIGVIPVGLAVNYGLSGPILRGSGIPYDLRRVDGYSIYPELDFEIPYGKGEVGKLGDCWDRTSVRLKECYESIKIMRQCVHKLDKEHPRTTDFDPQGFVPKKIRPKAQEFYFRGEGAKGELAFYFKTDGRSDIPLRCKARGTSFVNLSILEHISKGVMLADLVAIVGSLDLVMGEVDR